MATNARAVPLEQACSRRLRLGSLTGPLELGPLVLVSSSARIECTHLSKLEPSSIDVPGMIVAPASAHCRLLGQRGGVEVLTCVEGCGVGSGLLRGQGHRGLWEVILCQIQRAGVAPRSTHCTATLAAPASDAFTNVSASPLIRSHVGVQYEEANTIRSGRLRCNADKTGSEESTSSDVLCRIFFMSNVSSW